MPGPQLASATWFDCTIPPMEQDGGEPLAIRTLPTMPAGLECSVAGNGVFDTGFLTNANTTDAHVTLQFPFPEVTTGQGAWQTDFILFDESRQNGIGGSIRGNGSSGALATDAFSIVNGVVNNAGGSSFPEHANGAYQDGYYQFGVSSGRGRSAGNIAAPPAWPSAAFGLLDIPVGLRYFVIQPSVGNILITLGSLLVSLDDGDAVPLAAESSLAVVSGSHALTFSA